MKLKEFKKLICELDEDLEIKVKGESYDFRGDRTEISKEIVGIILKDNTSVILITG